MGNLGGHFYVLIKMSLVVWLVLYTLNLSLMVLESDVLILHSFTT